MPNPTTQGVTPPKTPKSAITTGSLILLIIAVLTGFIGCLLGLLFVALYGIILGIASITLAVLSLREL